MILKIRARHLRNTVFTDNCNCAIGKALKEHFPNCYINEIVSGVIVDGRFYIHESYPSASFHEDLINATAHNFDDTVIRVVNIEGLQEPVELSTLTSQQLLQQSEVVT